MRLKGIPFRRVPRLLVSTNFHFDRALQVFIAVCDHYEPMRMYPARSIQDLRVERWVHGYPQSVAGISDSVGRNPQHTFFYPGDQYVPEHVDQIAGLCRAGFGDVEVHLHHQDDTSQSLRDKLEQYRDTLYHRHGLLQKSESGQVTYGFIHGNWALDNSHPDGRHCGVNDEISILRQTGCYADFTMPSAPEPCQTTTINNIYYAIDDPHRPKSHDQGDRARVGQCPPQDGLLMIQGPLGFDWTSRKWGFLPRLENGDLLGVRPPSIERFRLWCSAGVRVMGNEDWVFIKLHTHGAHESNTEMLLGEPMRKFHQELHELALRHPAFKYYYVTAREMAGLVHQAESGQSVPALGQLKKQDRHLVAT